MEENLTGMAKTSEGNRTDWSTPGSGSSALSQNQENGGIHYGELSKPTERVTEKAHEYVDKLSGAVTDAKDYVGEKLTNVGGKIKDFAQNDLGDVAEKAKGFARENPGQALLLAAGAGMILGLIVRARR